MPSCFDHASAIADSVRVYRVRSRRFFTKDRVLPSSINRVRSALPGCSGWHLLLEDKLDLLPGRSCRPGDSSKLLKASRITLHERDGHSGPFSLDHHDNCFLNGFDQAKCGLECFRIETNACDIFFAVCSPDDRKLPVCTDTTEVPHPEPTFAMSLNRNEHRTRGILVRE